MYSIAQKRMDSGIVEDDPKFVVVNNGTGVQIIILSGDADSQASSMFTELNKHKVYEFSSCIY